MIALRSIRPAPGRDGAARGSYNAGLDLNREDAMTDAHPELQQEAIADLLTDLRTRMQNIRDSL